MTSTTIKAGLAGLGLLALSACNDPSNDGIRNHPQSEPHITYIYSQATPQPCGTHVAESSCTAFT
ncbi:hypothetical protein G5B38_15435 [Pseudohalocynthiibacter aestuariivivens]|nr:hypothetical protein [Pseudohalocynthiibacter aestuariivivens]QIE46804.1 hypothetical protein G5B38_15435 [Pseudohalocynthiibacter aestuariivivens]